MQMFPNRTASGGNDASFRLKFCCHYMKYVVTYFAARFVGFFKKQIYEYNPFVLSSAICLLETVAKRGVKKFSLEKFISK